MTRVTMIDQASGKIRREQGKMVRLREQFAARWSAKITAVDHLFKGLEVLREDGQDVTEEQEAWVAGFLLGWELYEAELLAWQKEAETSRRRTTN